MEATSSTTEREAMRPRAELAQLKQEVEARRQRNAILELELRRDKSSTEAEKNARIQALEVEAQASIGTIERLTSQNMRFRIDLIKLCDLFNDMEAADRASEDGELKSTLTKYRRERNLPRDALRKAELELGQIRSTADWKTEAEQAASIGTGRGFNMYERMKNKLREAEQKEFIFHPGSSTEGEKAASNVMETGFDMCVRLKKRPEEVDRQ